jgi:hypothetical protein
MSYLDIIKELEEKLSGGGKPLSEAGKVRSEADTHCEKSELSEKSPLSASRAPAPSGKPAESAPDPIWTPPLGRENDRGELVLTAADLPELEHRLRLSGWKVIRRGNELVCSSRGASRIQ